MFERIILVAVLLVAGYLVFWTLTRLQIKRIRNKVNHDPILAGVEIGKPAIVYFTTPTCVVCETRQKPALQQLVMELGDAIQVIQIDATEQPGVASRWGVMSAPMTFVLDGAHQPKQINYGVADTPKLRKQIELANAVV